MMMRAWSILCLAEICCFFLFLPKTCLSSVRQIAKVNPGFNVSQTQYIDDNGLFLLSNSSNFGLGFNTNNDLTSFTVSITHMATSRVIWSANRGVPVGNSDNFVFDVDGNAYITSNGEVIWSTNTSQKGVSAMELRDSGNLVLVGNESNGVVWQSFDHPTNTLMPNQDFRKGMKLTSDPRNNLTFSLEIRSGDLVLSAEFKIPQPYWALLNDSRRIINRNGEIIEHMAIEGSSWRYFDQTNVLLGQFVFASDSDANTTWAAVLQDDGFIRFYDLPGQITGVIEIPGGGSCSTPQSCPPYLVCGDRNTCLCPSGLNVVNCKPSPVSCGASEGSNSKALINAGESLTYSALGFVPPSSETSLEGCKSSCLSNCSCLVMFFDNKSGNCYMFDEIGSFSYAKDGESFELYVKVSSTSKKKLSTAVVIAIVIAIVFVIICLVFLAVCLYKKKNKDLAEKGVEREDDAFLEGLSGMPIRFTYSDLKRATDNFSKKLGQGGFGSVYEGVLKDGTRLAVKQLEGIGQGKKEFRAEVSSIGGIHHHHLVRMKGFCAEGSHRLLVYEHMANGSLDRWLFKKNKADQFLLDWDTRHNIAVGTAKGLEYLHEYCDVKIVHCDIKPENVLLDENFQAKVSDFGLAKLMTREQSHVFTTLRGTRGYLAPEWIKRCPISEKSDVYSFGMVLLEIIGGRQNHDPSMISEKCNFPSYAFKMMEEGKVKEIVDEQMKIDEQDERVIVAIKVALLCIQDDMNLRPSMSKVVQILEGLSPVPGPLYSGLFEPVREEGTSSGPPVCNSSATVSSVQLSGPR